MHSYHTIRRLPRTRYYIGKTWRMFVHAFIMWGEGIALTYGWITLKEYREEKERHESDEIWAEYDAYGCDQ